MRQVHKQYVKLFLSNLQSYLTVCTDKMIHSITSNSTAFPQRTHHRREFHAYQKIEIKHHKKSDKQL